MKKKSKLYRIAILAAFVIAISILPKIQLFAAGAAVTFGSEEYEVKQFSDFYVGIYLNNEEPIGKYRVEITYDTEKLGYSHGADSDEDGVIILEGDTQKTELKYMVVMHSNTSSTSLMKVKRARMQIAGTGELNGEAVTELVQAPIVVGDGGDGLEPEDENEEDAGTSDTGEEGQEPEAGENAEEQNRPSTELPLLNRITLEETEYYLVDHDSYIPEELSWPVRSIKGSYQEEEVTWLTNEAQDIKLIYLVDQNGTASPYGYSEEKDTLYPCNIMHMDDQIYYCMSPYACKEWPQGLTVDIMQRESILFALSESGETGFYQIESGNRLKAWSEENAVQRLYEQNKKILWVFFVGILIIVCSLAVHFLRIYLIKQRWKKRRAENRKKQLQQESAALVEEMEAIALWEQEELPPNQEQPVIAVRNLCMRFRISTANTSGIKEYIIQRLKRQVSYRDLWALNHVSFCVYPGEVVGIIGTNGSGKSTLLKIVSGALAQSSGEVVVDRSKVQLLTLGTGFDTELTARENVYLNGAIIGYSKEYIDERFDDIVAFAELEGFMEEKVKNFSSGMVSRLGFAIATMRDTPEILILDEVLSVGDMFFRKKSEKRIREMIHGGSTVLIVSHSADVIVKNCTKAVWLEKGVVRKIGNAKEVCEAYKNMESGVIEV